MLDDSVTIKLAAAFDLGEVDGSAAYVDSGVSGEVFRIATATGDWALKRLFQDPDPAQLEIEIGLQDEARTAGVASPRAIRTKSGDLVAFLESSRWTAYEWANVSRDEVALLEPDRLAEVGDVLARLHGMRLAAPHDVTPWLTTPPKVSELRSLVRESGAAWAPAFEESYPELLRLEGFAAAGIPSGAVLSHCDLGPANVGIAEDHLVVFDWERAGAIPPVQELGYVLVQWADLGDAPTAVPHIVHGYCTGSREQIAINVDMFVCAANAFLNFLRAGIYNADERIVLRLLEKPVNLDRLVALADIARP